MSEQDDSLFGPEHVEVYRETKGERGYLVVDQKGGQSVLTRNTGLKKKDLDTFMKEVPLDQLPGVAEAKAIQEQRRAHSDYALLYLDLDQFKVINDTCGHAAGDELIRQVAWLIRDQLRIGGVMPLPGRLRAD